MPTLVLQRGHYPRKTGATGTSGEQAMAVRVGDAVKQLAPAGWSVRLIDADESASRYAGAAFVAVHGDGSENRAVCGASVGYRNRDGGRMATAWKEAYARRGWNGGWHRDNYTDNLGGYYGVRKAVEAGNESAIVIEVGFLTNPRNRAWIDAHTVDIAKSIWDAVAPGRDAKKPVARVIVPRVKVLEHTRTDSRVVKWLYLGQRVNLLSGVIQGIQFPFYRVERIEASGRYVGYIRTDYLTREA